MRGQTSILAPILFLATALRVYQLGSQSLWYDETVSAFLAGESLANLIAHTARDIHPPLYYLLLHFWTRLAGSSEFALAYVSVFWGILLVPLTYRVAQRLFDRPTGFLAALLVAVSPFNIWYSQEVRMYTLGSALGMLTLWAFLHIWSDVGDVAEGSSQLRLGRFAVSSDSGLSAAIPWLAWVLAAAAGLYTLYYFVFLLMAENLLALVFWFQARAHQKPLSAHRLRRWFGAQVAVAILYLPWLPVFFRQATDPPVPPWRSFAGFPAALHEVWSALAFGQSVPLEPTLPALLLITAIYLVGLWPRRGGATARLLGRPVHNNGHSSNTASALLAGYTILPMLAIWLISYALPLYHVRYSFLFAGPFYILLAWGLRRLYQRRHRRTTLGPTLFASAALAAYGLVALFSLYQFWNNPLYAADDLRGGVGYIRENLGSNDVVLVNAGYAYTAFRHYFPGDIAWQGRLTDYPEGGIPRGTGAVVVETGIVNGSPGLGWGLPESDFFAMPWPQAEMGLERLARHHSQLWHFRIYDTVTDPGGRIRSWLEERALLVDDRLLDGESNVRVQAWRVLQEPPFASPDPEVPVGVTFGDQIVQLVGYDNLSPAVVAGEHLQLSLYWRWQAVAGHPAARTDFSLSIGLFDERGRRWTQLDAPMGQRLYPTSRWSQNEVVEEVIRLPMPLGIPSGDYFLDVTVYDPTDVNTLPIADGAWSVTGSRVRLGIVSVSSPSTWPEAAWPDLPGQTTTRFGSQIQLVRYDVPGDVFHAGQSIGVKLLWRGLRPQDQDREIVLALLDEGGQLVASAVHTPADGRHPTSQWKPGEVVLDLADVPIPGHLPTGNYHVAVAVRSADGTLLDWREGLFGSAGTYYPLNTLVLVGREASFTAPTVANTVGGRLGNFARLVGFDLDRAEARPGDVLRLTLYWEALELTGESYKVLNHLVGPDGQIAGQHDGFPANGTLPTFGWIAGEFITDPHEIRIADDTPPGTYRLITGMYREQDQVRLPAFSAAGEATGDTILLAEIQVSP